MPIQHMLNDSHDILTWFIIGFVVLMYTLIFWTIELSEMRKIKRRYKKEDSDDNAKHS